MKKNERMLDEIEKILQHSFDPIELVVLDVSEAHRGHSGFQEGGQSHFEVEIVAACFSTMNRLTQHRAIHTALGSAVMEKIHALALKVRGT
jgi:BolA protein